jgi:hypothetical protein
MIEWVEKMSKRIELDGLEIYDSQDRFNGVKITSSDEMKDNVFSNFNGIELNTISIVRQYR